MGIRISFVIGLILCSFTAEPQTCCTGGVPMVGAFVIPETNKGEWGLHLTYNYNNNNDLLSEGEELDDSFIQRKISTALFQGDYALTDELSFSVVLPYLWQAEIVSQSQTSQEYKNNGIGDISVWTHYTWELNTLTITPSLGVKIPTGSTNQQDESVNILLPFSLQNGSGSWDFGYSVQASLYLDRKRNFSWENQIFGRYNTKGKAFEAHENYRFGSQFQLFSGLAYHSLVFNYPSDFYTGLVMQHRRKDEFEGGFDNDNTGGTWYNVTLGGNSYLTTDLSLGFNVLLPVHRETNGLQLSTSWQAALVVNYLFNKDDEIY